jgi:2,3-dihydroxy-p-cumate/2,3-dihydroxybenzoate 3,4-dioxygenase
MQIERELDPFSLPAARPASRLRYRKLAYVALNISDLDRSREFYEKTVGFQYSGGDERCAFFRCSSDHHNLALYRSANPGLRQIGWELEDDDVLAASFASLQTAGLDVQWLSAAGSAELHLDRAFFLIDPTTGVRHDYFSTMSEFAIEPFRPTVANILRLGHVVLKSDRYDEAIEFATKTLNFRLSDSVRDKVTFMRCFPSPFHHGMAIIKSDRPLLHHVNFMVDSIDDVGRGFSRLQAAGVPIVYGPGRHPPSDSIFLYFLDPDGLTVEYSFGMEQFPEAGARKARVFEPIAALDYWSSRQDKRFGAIGAIDPSAAVR